MKKLIFIFILSFSLVAVCGFAQKKFSVYAVGFYNQENLFDTCHEEGKNDYEFLPSGSYRWTGLKYSHKLRNMARVLAEMGTDKLPQVGCAVIGLSEVENSKVLDDLTAQEPLRARGYKYVHVEGPDRRGVDCALLYNPALFKVGTVNLLPYVPDSSMKDYYATRGFLTVTGEMGGDQVCFIVCHWPSRAAGPSYRNHAAAQVKAIKDSLLRVNPDMKVMVMGDMNDDPTNKSMKDILRALPDKDDVGEGDMYNPWYNLLAKEGQGTLSYQGSWNLFDQIVLTPNMIDKNGKRDYSTLKFWTNQIFRRDYIINKEGRYKGIPKRTHAGGAWLDGYSDHLPVIVYLVKEQQ